MATERIPWSALPLATQEEVKIAYMVGRFRTPADLATEFGVQLRSMEAARRAEDWDTFRTAFADEQRRTYAMRLRAAGDETAENLGFAMRDLTAVARERAAEALEEDDIVKFNEALALVDGVTARLEKMRHVLEGLTPRDRGPAQVGTPAANVEAVQMAKQFGLIAAKAFTAVTREGQAANADQSAVRGTGVPQGVPGGPPV